MMDTQTQQAQTKPTFNLTKKLVLGMVGVSAVTYGTSAFFIFYFSNFFTRYIPGWAYTTIILLLGVLWSGILGYFAARFLTNVIWQIQEGVTLAAKGDLTVELQVKPTKDELMSLSKMIQAMIFHLKETVLGIHTYSTKAEEKGHILTARVAEATEQSKAIGLTTEEIAKGAERQSQIALETFEAIQNSMAKFQGIETHVSESAGLSKEMVMTLEEGEGHINSLINGILHLADVNQLQVKQVDELSREANEIGLVTKVVGKFVEQTNLLALNATIEAARAGEEGLGFSVVASEIQKLANESGHSLKRIDELIKAIQDKVENVVTHIQSQLLLVNEEKGKANRTDQALSDVKASVFKVTTSIEKIKKETEEQKQTMNQIYEQAEEIAAVAEVTSAGAEEVAASTQEQEEIMEELLLEIRGLTHDTKELVGQVQSLKVS